MVTRTKWDPNLHPRGPIGRFIPAGEQKRHETPGWLARSQRDSEDIQDQYTDEYLTRSTRPLTDHEVAHLHDYANGSGHINGTLRRQETGRGTTISTDPDDLVWGETEDFSWEDRIRNLDSAIEQNRLSQDTVLYRATDFDAWVGDRPLMPGDQLLDRGYLSTSVDPDVLEDWVDSRDRLEIEAPEGTSVALPSLYNEFFGGQAEMILGRGTVLEIIEVNGGMRDGKITQTVRARLVGYIDD